MEIHSDREVKKPVKMDRKLATGEFSRRLLSWRLEAGGLCVLALLFTGCEGEPVRAAPFWEILHEGRSSILLGTMHDVVDADELPQRIWEELEDASLVTTEADVRFILPQEFREAITLPDGQTIQTEVTETEWQSLGEAFSGSYTPEELDRLQPWYLEGALIRTLVPTVDNPIDTTIVDRAFGSRIDLEFFETWQDQVTLLNQLGLEEGLLILMRTVEDQERAAVLHLEWADAYRSGDIERLTELAFDPEAMAATPRYYEEIVFQRNEAWLPMIEEQLQNGDALIAVGFMHMPMDRGLVSLLEARGYAVNFVER